MEHAPELYSEDASHVQSTKFETRKMAELIEENQNLKNRLQQMHREKSCNYQFVDLVHRPNNSIEKILRGVPEVLICLLQHPEVACARVIYAGNEFKTKNFKATAWKRTANVFVNEAKVGQMEVYYKKKMPICDEGPFLKEEVVFLNSLARRLGKIAERHQTKIQLESEKASLNNMNIALQEVLKKIQDEKNHIRENIQANVDKVIEPLLNALEMKLSHKDNKIAGLLRKNLKEIVSPFSNTLSKEFVRLTPVEINICNMIKNGLSTKEIARTRHISPATVSKQRENIRKKLNLTNRKTNLATYLNTFMNQ